MRRLPSQKNYFLQIPFEHSPEGPTLRDLQRQYHGMLSDAFPFITRPSSSLYEPHISLGNLDHNLTPRDKKILREAFHDAMEKVRERFSVKIKDVKILTESGRHGHPIALVGTITGSDGNPSEELLNIHDLLLDLPFRRQTEADFEPHITLARLRRPDRANGKRARLLKMLQYESEQWHLPINQAVEVTRIRVVSIKREEQRHKRGRMQVHTEQQAKLSKPDEVKVSSPMPQSRREESPPFQNPDFGSPQTSHHPAF